MTTIPYNETTLDYNTTTIDDYEPDQTPTSVTEEGFQTGLSDL